MCDLASQTKPQAWAKEVKEVYNSDRSVMLQNMTLGSCFDWIQDERQSIATFLHCRLPDYVARVESPMRSHYPGQRAEGQEIIESLVGDPDYNAYEKDIAVVNIFFGKPTTIGRN